jgi:hypothetical protein
VRGMMDKYNALHAAVIEYNQRLETAMGASA